MSAALLGVDIGGTFTDFVLVQDGALRIHKRLSTPQDPAAALLEGVRSLELDAAGVVIHGTTIATNALLERRGARTALIITAGFADLIEIGRQDRPDLYALTPTKPAPLIPAELRFELHERIDAQGQVLIALEEAEIVRVTEQLRASGAEAVAICLLFSFLNPEHEQRIGAALKAAMPELFVTLSCELLPEYREYERSSSTAINAYVGPLIDRYLARVEAGLAGRSLLIMQSNGGVIRAETARKEAARTALSGPAAGAVGAFHVGRLAGFEQLISFDMGGTSTDVAIFPGEIRSTRESNIDGMPLRLPVVDIHTVGAGGGSIARLDAGGALRVGPESAGAQPGPACYGRGELPTTTDANLVLGRLQADQFLAGAMKLYPERARTAVARLAEAMGLGVEAAALGVIRVANASMERAIRRVSVERGYDPRDFALVPFGGAGPLHACELADSLGMRRILIPAAPGVLSALGMAIADRVRDASTSVLSALAKVDTVRMEAIFAPMEARLSAELRAEGLPPERIRLTRSLEMRYRGQSHEVAVTQPADGDWAEAFHRAHEQLYSHRGETARIEVTAARLQASGLSQAPDLRWRGGQAAMPAPIKAAEVWLDGSGPVQTACYARESLGAGLRFQGPALFFQLDSTLMVAAGWQAAVDSYGNLILSK